MSSCTVVGCKSNWRTNKERKFFRIPAVIKHHGEQVREITEKRRAAWVANIGRKNHTMTKGTRICDLHFVSGRPASLMEINNPDWAPTMNMGRQLTGSTLSPENAMNRYNRLVARRETKKISSQAGKSLSGAVAQTNSTDAAEDFEICNPLTCLGTPHSVEQLPLEVEIKEELPDNENACYFQCQPVQESIQGNFDPASNCTSLLKSVAVQTDLSGGDISTLTSRVDELLMQIEILKNLKSEFFVENST